MRAFELVQLVVDALAQVLVVRIRCYEEIKTLQTSYLLNICIIKIVQG